MMAVAALFMPLLFSCSGGSSSKNNLLGAIPDQYAQFVEEKAPDFVIAYPKSHRQIV